MCCEANVRMVDTSRASHWGTIFRKKLRDELAPDLRGGAQ